MRESAFMEKLFMILSIGDKRLRNYLLPCLGEPAPSATSKPPPTSPACGSSSSNPGATVLSAAGSAASESEPASLAEQAAAAAAEAWFLAGNHAV